MGKAFAELKRMDSGFKFYAVFRPDTDEFLAMVNPTEEAVAYGWCQHPSSAMQIKGFDKARSAAMLLSMDKGIEVHVCAVRDVGERYEVELESRFFPDLP